eukprot:6665617-Pyramimonas_sp.AAC.2
MPFRNEGSNRERGAILLRTVGGVELVQRRCYVGDCGRIRGGQKLKMGQRGCVSCVACSAIRAVGALDIRT